MADLTVITARLAWAAAVTMQIQAGIRPTVFSTPGESVDGDPAGLRYLVVPLRLP